MSDPVAFNHRGYVLTIQSHEVPKGVGCDDGD